MLRATGLRRSCPDDAAFAQCHVSLCARNRKFRVAFCTRITSQRFHTWAQTDRQTDTHTHTYTHTHTQSTVLLFNARTQTAEPHTLTRTHAQAHTRQHAHTCPHTQRETRTHTHRRQLGQLVAVEPQLLEVRQGPDVLRLKTAKHASTNKNIGRRRRVPRATIVSLHRCQMRRVQFTSEGHNDLVGHCTSRPDACPHSAFLLFFPAGSREDNTNEQ